jgi:hypothetical protein
MSKSKELPLQTEHDTLLSMLNPIAMERKPQTVIDEEIMNQFFAKFNLNFFCAAFFKTADYEPFPYKVAVNIVGEDSFNVLQDKFYNTFGNTITLDNFQVGEHSIELHLKINPSQEMVYKKTLVQKTIECDLTSAFNAVLDCGHVFQKFDMKNKTTVVTKSLDSRQSTEVRVGASFKTLLQHIQSYYYFFFNILTSFNKLLKSVKMDGISIGNFTVKIKKVETSSTYELEFLKVAYSVS